MVNGRREPDPASCPLTAIHTLWPRQNNTHRKACTHVCTHAHMSVHACARAHTHTQEILKIKKKKIEWLQTINTNFKLPCMHAHTCMYQRHVCTKDMPSFTYTKRAVKPQVSKDVKAHRHQSLQIHFGCCIAACLLQQKCICACLCTDRHFETRAAGDGVDGRDPPDLFLL